jgi:hypothetical protein
MLEWKPRLVLLLVVMASFASMVSLLGLGISQIANIGWE